MYSWRICTEANRMCRTRVAFACGRALVVSHLSAARSEQDMTASVQPALVPGGDVVHWSKCPEGKLVSSTLAVPPGDQIMCIAWVKLPRVFSSEELGVKDHMNVMMEDDDDIDGGSLHENVAQSQQWGRVPSWHVLLLGTSSGNLQVHTCTGSLLHVQRVHDSPVMNIQARSFLHLLLYSATSGLETHQAAGSLFSTC